MTNIAHTALIGKNSTPEPEQAQHAARTLLEAQRSRIHKADRQLLEGEAAAGEGEL